MKKVILVLQLILLLLCSSNLTAQNLTDSLENSSEVSFNSNLVSRYVWRGIQFEATPHIQPTFEYSTSGFTVGVWGSYGISEAFAEIDLFASYTYKYFTVTVFDYFIEDETNLSLNNYFEWRNGITPHALEGTFSFNGTEKFPVTFTAATFFYGNDQNSNGDNYFSTYLEVGYSKLIKSVELSVKLGGTPSRGMYASKAGIVNCSLLLSKEIGITEKYSLPVFTELVLNPSAKDIFFVFGVTL